MEKEVGGKSGLMVELGETRKELLAELEAEGKRMGFRAIASGPFVRSSYKSGELFSEQNT